MIYPGRLHCNHDILEGIASSLLEYHLEPFLAVFDLEMFRADSIEKRSIDRAFRNIKTDSLLSHRNCRINEKCY